MCGIAGILSLDGRPVTAEELSSMCAVMVHRGPDDEGAYLGPGVGLAMRRLSIIDLATGHQPVHNEDGSVWVVLNGEIYNYHELRGELERRGHRFYTTTDTEVIVHLYEERGPRCVDKLRGMFAFAVWDEERRELLVARDRLGIKPLYYGEIGGRLVFASELKAILALGGVEPRLDWRALSHLFACQVTPRDQSIVQGIRKLEPAHVLVASPERKLDVRRYWDVAFEPDWTRTEAGFVERLRELLEESVRLHLVSDVPLGAFLSGGVDSSSVVALMSRFTTGPVKTFSIGFDEPDYDELEHARLVARTFGTDHKELVLEPRVFDILDDLVWHLDEPFGDSSAIPTYMVSKLASESVTVVLSGDGGDELFAGYDKYVVEGRERRYRVLPAPLRWALGGVARAMPEGMRGRNFLRHHSLAGIEPYLHSTTMFRREQQRRLFTREAFAQLGGHDPWSESGRWLGDGRLHWLSALQYSDLNTYLPLDILTKVDRMSMAHSIEARVPLLDHKVVEFAATIPPELQLHRGVTKHIFKRAMRGLLPESITARPKQGFAVPLARWFRGRLGAVLRDLLLSETSRRRGILDPRYIERLIGWHENGQDLYLKLWTLMSFELWCRRFLDARPAPPSVPAPRRLAALEAPPR